MSNTDFSKEIKDFTRTAIKDNLILGIDLWGRQDERQILFGGHSIYSLKINVPAKMNGVVDVVLLEGKIILCKTNLQILKDNVTLSPSDMCIEISDTEELDDIIDKVVDWIGICNNFIYF